MPEGQSSEVVDLSFTIALEGGSIRSVFPVPAGQTTLTQILPIIKEFTSGVVRHVGEVAARNGKPVSCGPQCGACCRQLVPISSFEAEDLANWIRSLPAEQQGRIAMRFQRALLALQNNGVLAQLNPTMFDLSRDDFKQLGLAYFSAGVACPFLVDESCSIHLMRPLVCREYIVVSPPEYCAEPGHRRVDGVVLPLRPSRAMIQLGKRVEGDPQGWLPLVFLFHWMTAGLTAGNFVSGTGQEVLQTFLETLTQQKSVNAAAAVV